MQPIEFKGRQNPDSFVPYVFGVVALLGLVSGLVISFPAFAMGWAIVWIGLAYLKYRSRNRDVQFFRIRLDDLGIEIRDRRRSYAARWREIESIEWTPLGSRGNHHLVFKSRTQKYIYDHLLTEADFSDFIQALKMILPDKTGNLPRFYYNTYVHGRVLAAHAQRRLKQPDKAEQNYREAIEAGEKSASALGLGMIPVLEEYAALLERQGKHTEAQTLTSRIASLVGRVVQ